MHHIHAFEHARRLILSAPMLLHPTPLVVPLAPGLALELQPGVPFGIYSYPHRYAAPDHVVRGAIVLMIIIPF